MIKASQLAQQMIDFQKFSFLGCYDAACAMQQQATSTMDLMLNHAGWIPSEGRQAISTWMDTCQEEGDRFKVYVEKSFANLGMYFTDKGSTVKAKTKQPAPAKAKKAAAVEPKKEARPETKKAAPAAAKKAVPVAAKKAAPVETVKAAPTEPKPAKIAGTKKTSPTKKQNKKILK